MSYSLQQNQAINVIQEFTMTISDAELDQLLRDLESDRVERKAAFSDPDRVRQVVCAFANDLPNYQLPGVVFIGVNDDGSCTHTSITDELLINLSNMRDVGIPLARAELMKNGNPSLEFVVEEAHILAIIRRNP